MERVNPGSPLSGLTPLPERPTRPGRRLGTDPPADGEVTSRPGESDGITAAMSTLAPSSLLNAIPADLIETFHYLVARLQLNEAEALPTTIGIVAATHGEGVSTVARSFAAVLANDLDVKVCLVDLKPPSSSQRNPPAIRPQGLFDVLNGDVDLINALIETADPRVVVLNAGKCDAPSARNLVRSTSLAKIFDELESICDYVIVDVPPILVGSEGIALLRHTRGYLMVVHQGVTPVDQVRAAVEEMGSIPAIGVILNQCTTKIPKRLQRFFRV